MSQSVLPEICGVFTQKKHTSSASSGYHISTSQSRNQSSRRILAVSFTVDDTAAEVLGFGAESSSLALSSLCSGVAVSDSTTAAFVY